MIKVILFDCDGLIIKHNKYFSQRLKEERGIETDNLQQSSFFKNEFLLCEKGHADLKVELAKRLAIWGWQGTVEELMDFWFKGEAEVDREMENYIIELRKKGIKTYLSTNNEKYRVNFLWNIAGLNNILDATMASCELGYLKPEKEFWAAAHHRLGNIEKSQVLVWDDVQSAITSARFYGFNAEFYSGFAEFKNIMSKKYAIG